MFAFSLSLGGGRTKHMPPRSNLHETPVQLYRDVLGHVFSFLPNVDVFMSVTRTSYEWNTAAAKMKARSLTATLTMSTAAMLKRPGMKRHISELTISSKSLTDLRMDGRTGGATLLSSTLREFPRLRLIRFSLSDGDADRFGDTANIFRPFLYTNLTHLCISLSAIKAARGKDYATRVIISNNLIMAIGQRLGQLTHLWLQDIQHSRTHTSYAPLRLMGALCECHLTQRLFEEDMNDYDRTANRIEHMRFSPSQLDDLRALAPTLHTLTLDRPRPIPAKYMETMDVFEYSIDENKNQCDLLCRPLKFKLQNLCDRFSFSRRSQVDIDNLTNHAPTLTSFRCCMRRSNLNFPRLPNLTSLELAHVGNFDLAHLHHCVQLATLTLTTQRTILQSKHFHALMAHAPLLRALSLVFCDSSAIDSLEFLATAPSAAQLMRFTLTGVQNDFLRSSTMHNLLALANLRFLCVRGGGPHYHPLHARRFIEPYTDAELEPALHAILLCTPPRTQMPLLETLVLEYDTFKLR